MRVPVGLAIALGLLCMAAPARAQVPLEGSLVAKSDCPAYQSFRNETNPGGIRLAVGQTYRVVGKNAESASHYFVEVEGATPARRWVAIDCGDFVVASEGDTQPLAKAQPQPKRVGDKRATRFVFAVSWQPAFCETKPRLPECKAQTEASFDASHFTLHGLWPQPRTNEYCKVPRDVADTDRSGDWDDLPAPELTTATRKALDRVMPGTRSSLDRHEWVRHGTCFGGSAEEYFRASIALLDQLNASGVREFFVDSIGGEISAKAIRRSFDKAFGPGVGERVKVACKDDGDRRLIVELTLGLVGEVGDDPDLKSLMMASSPTTPGCPSGIVDLVGNQ